MKDRAGWALRFVASALLLFGYARLESPLHLLGLVAFVPFLSAVDRTRSAARALGAGWLMSVGYVAAGLHWFPGAIERYTGAPARASWALMLLAAPLLQPQLLALAWARRFLAPTPWLAALGGAGAYVGLEWLAPRLLADTLGYGLYPGEWLRQGAELVGARGLTFLLLLANAALLEAAGRKRWRPAAAVVAGLALFSAFGAWRVHAVRSAEEARPAIRVALVQANLTHYAELANALGTYGAVRTILDTHYALTEQAGKVDLVVWPETVYPTTFGSPQSEEGGELDAEIEAFVQRRGVPLVLGAYDREGDAEFNASFFVSPGEHVGSSAYRKTHLFPLTEWVPDELDGPGFRQAFPWTGTWKRGPGPKTVTLQLAGRAVKVAPLICYDAVYPGFVAASVRDGAELIVTLSNDAWFSGTLGPRLHLAAAAFRSIETRRPQLRATNSGVSAVIDATGEVTARGEDDRREVVTGSVTLGAAAMTPMIALGDWAGAAGLLIAAAAVARSRGRGWRRRSSSAPAT